MNENIVPSQVPTDDTAAPTFTIDAKLRTPAPKSFGEHVKSAAAYAFIATIFMAGFGVAAAIWSSSLSPIQLDLTHAREERDQAQAELNQVKSEYALFRAQTPPASKVPLLEAVQENLPKAAKTVASLHPSSLSDYPAR